MTFPFQGASGHDGSGWQVKVEHPGRTELGSGDQLESSKMISYLEKLLHTLTALEHPGALKEFLTSKAFSVPCFRLNLALKRQQAYFGTILDVGANVGQFALAAALHFPEAEIYSFEPLPDVFSELQKNTRRKKNIKSFNCALGDYNGEILLHRNQYTRLSSSLEIHKNNDNPRYRDNRTSTIDVDIFRLDEFKNILDFRPPVLLKLDVQGMELDVLKGSTNILGKIDCILCEAPLVQLYDNQPVFDEIHCYTKSCGYKLVAPLFLNMTNNGKIIEMDVFYEKYRK
jgi:FkbM family methyltransferase